MSLEKNKAIVRRSIDAINNQDLSVVDNLVSADFIDHTRQTHGSESLKQFLTMIFKSFPDFHINIEDIIAEGDKVWILVKTNTGKHTGEFMGIAPTGKKLSTLAVDILRVVNGKIVEYRDVVDRLDFLNQLCIIKYTEMGKKLFQQE